MSRLCAAIHEGAIAVGTVPEVANAAANKSVEAPKSALCTACNKTQELTSQKAKHMPVFYCRDIVLHHNTSTASVFARASSEISAENLFTNINTAKQLKTPCC